jgi:hypothetical protein
LDDEMTLAPCPISPEHLFYKMSVSLALLFYVNNKEHLFNLNGNDENDIPNVNFKETLNKHIQTWEWQ